MITCTLTHCRRKTWTCFPSDAHGRSWWRRPRARSCPPPSTAPVCIVHGCPPFPSSLSFSLPHLPPSLCSLGTFTISNLGMFGVAQFDAILPPGTGSILAIAASTPKVVQLKNGHFGVQKSMTVTITCDHRHIYGADAAEFLKDLAGELTLIAQHYCMHR